jgi:hypothetical protein
VPGRAFRHSRTRDRNSEFLAAGEIRDRRRGRQSAAMDALQQSHLDGVFGDPIDWLTSFAITCPLR